MGNCLYSSCYNRDLLSHTKETTDLFSLEGQSFRASVVDVYDGDTVQCVFKFKGDFLRFKIRMAGYDSPEMKPSKSIDEPLRLAEKAAAVRARDVLKEKVTDRVVELTCGGFDKYGRLLGILCVYERGVRTNINAWMVSNGYGTPYDGGKKVTFQVAH